jgi:hypothetical protein
MPANTKKFAPQIASPRATRKNELWATEIVFRDDSQSTQILIVLDVFSDLPVVMTVLDPAASTAGQLSGHVTDAIQRSGRPRMLWVEASFKVNSQELDEFAMRYAIDICYGARTQKRRHFAPFLRRLRRFLGENGSSKPDDLKRDLGEWRELEERRQRYATAAE